MKVYGLIGRRLGHSFSAGYFKSKFDELRLNATYLNFPIASLDELQGILMSQSCLRGFNVTIPYKEEIMRYMDHLTDTALRVGAVNSVRIEPDGSLLGHNTDKDGFGIALDKWVKGFKLHRSLILGTGGASKAVAVALAERGVEVKHVSRDVKRGDLTYSQLQNEDMEQFDLIVNTTPLGMWPDTGSLPPIPYRGLGNKHYCFDLVYNPTQTAFMQSAAAQGAHVCNGMEMLRQQAEAAWEWWNEV